MAAVVGYALSPIDLIPDFIPVVGFLDDALIVPLGIWLALHMIPAEVMEECRRSAALVMEKQTGKHRLAAAVVVCVWVVLAGLALLVMLHMVRAR